MTSRRNESKLGLAASVFVRGISRISIRKRKYRLLFNSIQQFGVSVQALFSIVSLCNNFVSFVCAFVFNLIKNRRLVGWRSCHFEC